MIQISESNGFQEFISETLKWINYFNLVVR